MKNRFGRLTFVLLLAVIVVVISLGACEDGNKKGNGIPYEEHDTITASERFVLISRQGTVADWRYHIYVDRETRVMYWNICGDWKSGLTPILKADGTPELYEGDL